MRPKALKEFLIRSIEKGHPVCITGRPGIGKTDITNQAVASLGYDLLVLHPTVDDPIDYKGLPAIVDQDGQNKAEFLPYGNLRQMIDADKPLVVFFDDLGQAAESIQKALMQLLLSRSINGQAISEHVRFVAATNRKEDKAGVTGLLEPVKSRFASIVELEVSLDDWMEWAVKAGIHHTILAFMKFAPQHFDNFKPTKDMTNSISPRTLAHLNQWVQMGLSDLCRFDAYHGAIGSAATEYEAFEHMANQLIPPQEIIKQPDKAPLPDRSRADICYATVMGLASIATQKNIEAVVKFLNRFEHAGLLEFAVLCYRSIIDRDITICSNSMAWNKWAAKNKDVIK